MTNPILLTALGSNVALFAQCSDCGAIYHLVNKVLAEQCCSPGSVKCMREGCEERKETSRAMCKKHGDEYHAELEAARWAKAETVTESEQVTNGEGDFWDSVESYADELDLGTPAHFVWATQRVHMSVEPEDIIQRIIENWWNCEDCDAPELNGVKAFTKACLEFEQVNMMHYLYEPDYTKKLAVDAIPETDDSA